MIGNSLPEYVFIRLCIAGLQAVAPLAVLWLLARAARLLPAAHHHPALDALALLETLFLLVVYLPLKARAQAPALHPPTRPQAERRALMLRILDTIPDGDRFISDWFQGADIDSVRQDNVKEYLSWAFFNCEPADLPSQAEHDELTDLIALIEAHDAAHGRKFAPGRGPVTGMRLTLDPVRIKHRPLIWYLLLMAIDHGVWLAFVLAGYSFHHPAINAPRLPQTFPPRLHALAPTTQTSPSRHLSYFYHPHTSKTHLPIVLLHGIGVGLMTYLPMLLAINKDRPADDQIGVVAIEVMPVSFRLTSRIPDADVLAADIRAICLSHGFNRSVLVSHSYGSVVTSHLLKSPDTPEGMFFAAVMIDPVSILVHHASVAWNFLYRQPVTAAQWQLHYFASTDAGVARTLTRSFFWHQNTLWRQDLKGVELSAVLGGRDLIVDTKTVAGYLSQGAFDGLPKDFVIWDSQGDQAGKERRRSRGMNGTSNGNGNSHAPEAAELDEEDEDVRILWFNDADHADVVDVVQYRREVIQEIVWRCRRGVALA